MSASYFEIIDSGYQVPIEAIVFVLASVGLLDNTENLTLPVDMFYRHSDGCLLSVVLLLLLAERVLLTCLVRQY